MATKQTQTFCDYFYNYRNGYRRFIDFICLAASTIFMNVVATNDAYIQSSTTILSPQVSGYITEIYVKDFETIKEGQPLFQIDKRIFTQRVEEARANLTIAQNALKTYAQDYLLHEANIKEKEAQIKAVEANL